MRPFQLLLLLTGCQPVPEPACPCDVDGWYGTLARFSAGGRAGAFALDLPEPWLAGVEGLYEPAVARFAWELSYAEGYFLVEERAVGAGWIAADGDYLLEWSQEQEDALGVLVAVGVREQRRGCAVVTEITGDVEALTEATIQDADTVVGLTTAPHGDYDVRSTWRSDGSRDAWCEGRDGVSWYDVREPGDGTRAAIFLRYYPGGREEGGYERAFDGTRDYRFDRFPDEGEWVVEHIRWLLRYDGSGEGEVTGERQDGSTLTCWYAWDADGVGGYTCDDGSSGPY